MRIAQNDSPLFCQVLPGGLWDTPHALLPKYQIIPTHLVHREADLIHKPKGQATQVSN